jgi:hypothetical protein
METSTTPASSSPPRRRSSRRSVYALGGGLLAMILALSPLPFSVRSGSAPGGWAAPRQLLRNGGFEDAEIAPWGASGSGTHPAPGEGRGGSRAMRCEAPGPGAFQTVVLDQTRSFPIRVSGWSRAEEVDGSPDDDYALYVSVEFADGSRLERVSAEFDCGSHDWQRRELRIPALQPVKSLVLHCLFRNHAGRAWFDDVSVEELAPAPGSLLFEGGPWSPPPAAPPATLETDEALKSSGRFLVRDAAADGAWRRFDGPVCRELSVELETRWQAAPDHLTVEGELRDVSRTDRSMSLAFLLPLDATGWSWGDDVRRSRRIEPGGVYVHAVPVPSGATASLSRYPMAAVFSDRAGVAIAADPGAPVQFRAGYHGDARCLFISYDFGLLPDGVILPSRARFRFSLYRFDPAEGFRGALQKLYGIYPERFVRRCLQAGAWLPFTPTERIPRWEDFGFAFREAAMTEAPAGPEPLRTFRYTEPLGWWMALPPSVPRTADGLAAHLREAGPSAPPADAVVTASDGRPRFSFRRQPWCDGVLWSMNPNPLLPGAANAAARWWNSDVRDRLYLRDGQPAPGGEFVDSAEGYAMADLDFDRLHLRYATSPPSWSSETRTPVLFKGQMMHEYVSAAARDLHPLGRFLFGNGTPDRFAFLAPAFDILGTEVDWFPGGAFRPSTDGELSFRRAMAFQKPFCILLNTRLRFLTPEKLESYFQRCLFYGMFPSLFSHDAQNDSYWENPALYERDRPLFLKYMPLLRRIASAGWQPATLARSDNPAILLERFGPDGRGLRYLTLLNDAPTTQEATVTLQPAGPGRPLPVEARERITDAPLAVDGGRIRVSVPPGAVRLLELREPAQK